MYRWLMLFCVFAALSLGSAHSEAASPSWKELSRGKGVVVVKIRKKNNVTYWIAQMTNRVIPLRAKVSREFASLDSLLDFIKQKPAKVTIWAGTPESVKGGDGKFQPFSDKEKELLFGEKRP